MFVDSTNDGWDVICVFVVCVFLFFFKQKTAYEMRISDWSSDVCSSDLKPCLLLARGRQGQMTHGRGIDLLGAVKIADARQEIAEREDAFHPRFGDAERCRNIGNLAALDRKSVV